MVYKINAICTANACRSRIVQAVFEDDIDGTDLEGKVQITSSGLQVDKIRDWSQDGNYFGFDTIMKVIRAADKNCIQRFTKYQDLVDQVMEDPAKAEETCDNDPTYKAAMNMAASRLYHLVEQLDIASTRVVLAHHGLLYPSDEKRQFVPDGSDLYIAMERKHTEKIRAQAEPDAEVKCFDDFIDGEMEGSLKAIDYNPHTGRLCVDGHIKIYYDVCQGCKNLFDYSWLKVFGKTLHQTILDEDNA